LLNPGSTGLVSIKAKAIIKNNLVLLFLPSLDESRVNKIKFHFAETGFTPKFALCFKKMHG